MSGGHDRGGIARRNLLQGAGLAAGAVWAAGAARAKGEQPVAVVFLSRSGATRMLAGHLSRRLGGDLYEIRPRDPWPADYEEMVAWARRWQEANGLLPLDRLPDLSRHATVFLGFPIWGMALPAPVRALLSRVDVAGKTLHPFVTHGGHGTGSALSELGRLAPGAKIAAPFVLECDQERRTLTEMEPWLRAAQQTAR